MAEVAIVGRGSFGFAAPSALSSPAVDDDMAEKYEWISMANDGMRARVFVNVQKKTGKAVYEAKR